MIISFSVKSTSGLIFFKLIVNICMAEREVIDPTTVLSLYLSHDAAATYIDKKGKVKVLEYERFVKQRYAAFTKTLSYREGIGTTDIQRRNFLQYIKDNVKSEIEVIVHSDPKMVDKLLLQEYFPKAKFKLVYHHDAHAVSGFYTSNFNEATILSFDGGGYDEADTVTYTKAYIGKGKGIKPVKQSYDFSLGIPYGHVAKCIKEIKHGPDCSENSLVYSGKIMGLCGYGKVRSEWLQPMQRYYESVDFYGDNDSLWRLGQEIGLDLRLDTIEGSDGYDLAATSQEVFENKALQIIESLINEGAPGNIVLVGGCALNVLFNQKLSKILKKDNFNVYVPPYPNDCGLSLGQFLMCVGKKEKLSPYLGFDILDRDKFNDYKEEYKATECSVSQLVDHIKEGKIIGVLQGESEIGPRALGNRSIICDPSIRDMKDILNSKVKFREWYRPFAPVCALEDSEDYFDDVFESDFMSYAPKVKEEYRDVLPSITHIDGTARLQTVSKDGHKLFYNILKELKERNEIPVILNTSFNIKGAPILTTIEDALYVLDNTEMDYVYVEGFIFKKKS